MGNDLEITFCSKMCKNIKCDKNMRNKIYDEYSKTHDFIWQKDFSKTCKDYVSMENT